MKNLKFNYLPIVILLILSSAFSSHIDVNSLNGNFSGRSSFSPNMTGNLTISTSGSVVTIISTQNASLPADVSTVFFSSGITWSGDQIVFPNDGQKWWIVPFDGSAPTIVNVGGGGGVAEDVWEYKCYCGAVKQTTGCEIVETSNSKSCRWNDQCKSDCCQGVLEKVGTTKTIRGSAAIVPAQTLIFNGVTYN